MKKLLLGLGTVTAVIAPVVSVVACGTTTDDSKSLRTELSKIIEDNGYSVDQADLNTLEVFLGKDAKFISSVAGKETTTDGTHGSNDFVILIKSGDRRDLTKEKFQDTFTGGKPTSIEELTPTTIGVHSDANHSQTVGSIIDAADANWNFVNTDVVKADRIIYLQTNGTTATFELADLVTVNGKTFALNAGTTNTPHDVFDRKFDMPEIEVSWAAVTTK